MSTVPTPSLGTPLLLITNAGLAVASVAMPEGPYIHITSFQMGSAYGYTPLETDTGINGNLLFTGVPTTYEYIGNNTLNIMCEIPPDAGPFQFGEVALFLDGGVMFAKGVFPEPQIKYSALGTNVVESYTFNCLLKLQQSVAVFQIDTLTGPPAVADIYQWSDVYPPGVSANPDVPIYLVRELSDRGDASLLSNASDTEWTLSSTSYFTYETYGSSGTNSEFFTVTDSSTSWVQVAASACHPADLSAPNRRFVIQTPDGFYRSVSSVVASGSNYQFNLNVTNDGTYNNTPLLNAPPIGSSIRIYRDDQTSGSIYYSQIIDPPPPPALATLGNPGLAYGGSGLYMPSPGVITAMGLLHGPAGGGTIAGTGRVLTSSDNINDTTMVSGCYDSSIGSYGVPQNWPASWDGILQIVNYGTIIQTWYPEGWGGGSSGGVNGLPIYYRSYDNQQGAWSDWFPLSMVGKQGSGSLFAPNGYAKFAGGLILQWGTIPGTQGFATVTFPITFPNACLRVMNSVLLFGPGNIANNNYSGVVSFTNSTAYVGTDQNGTGWLAIGY
jgi:hypothetical protein